MNGNQLDFFNEAEMCNDAGAPEEEQICETCGSKLVRVGEKFVRSEWVIVPAQRSIWWTIMRPATSAPIAKQKPVQHPSGRHRPLCRL